MPTALPSLADLTDDQLLARVKTLAHEERRATAALIAALAELDERRLYLRQGYPSLFAYCTEALSLSEDAAYNRIRAARVAAKWPIVLEMIADGSVTVTAVRLLSDALTDTNHLELLRAARYKSKRDVEEILALLRPQPAVAPSIRKVVTPAAAPTSSPAVAAPLLARTSAGADERSCAEHTPQPAPIPKPATVAPLSADQYKIQVHDFEGDARYVSSRSGLDAPHESERRSRRHLRSGSDAAGRSPGKNEVRQDDSRAETATCD